MKKNRIVAAVFIFTILLSSCDGSKEISNDGKTEKTGTLIFNVNGRHYSSAMFVSEEGWEINLNHVYVSIENPTALQVPVEKNLSRHGGHDHAEIPTGTAHAVLKGLYFIDLHSDSPQKPVFELGRITDAAIGNYNYINFSLKNLPEDLKDVTDKTDDNAAERYKGYSMILVGTAKNIDEKTFPFEFKFDQEMSFQECGPQSNEIENNGVLAENCTASIEMTFHINSIFGDDSEPHGPYEPSPGSLNFLAVGFNPFYYCAGEPEKTGDIEFDLKSDKKKLYGNNTGNRHDLAASAIYFQLYYVLQHTGSLRHSPCKCQVLSR